MKKHRELAIIEKAERTLDRDFFHSIWVTLKFLDEDGFGTTWHQGFGGICLGTIDNPDEFLFESFRHDLCDAFNVNRLDELKGQKCFALYSFAGYNETVEGLESHDTGRKFVVTSWRRKHFPEQNGDPLKERISRLKSTIERSQDRVKRAREELRTIKKDYVDWTK